jgi:outer membrane lipoprotein-sorting protein
MIGRLTNVASLLLIVVVLLSPGPAASKKSDWLQRVAAAYSDLHSFRAQFEQETVQQAFGRSVTSAGEIAFRRGSFRWDYRWPEAQTYLVVDGLLSWYQPENRQVVRTKLDQAMDSGAPARLLGGLAEVERDFRLLEVGPTRDGVTTLILAPHMPDPAIERLELGFDPKAGIARVVTVEDALGNRNRIRLDRIQRNIKIEDAVFDAAVPSGWAVFTPNF